MAKRISLLLYELDSLTSADLVRLNHLFEKSPYNEEKEFGFYNIDYHPGYLSATFVKKSPTYITEYDSIKGTLIRNTIFIFSNVNFAFDEEYRLLEVYSTQNDSSKLRSVLSNSFFESKSLKQTTFSPYDVISKIKKEVSSLIIEKVYIENFQYQNKANGTFNINKIDQSFANELIESNKDGVKKVTLKVEINDLDNIEISFSTNGQLSIKAEDFNGALIFLKSIIFK